MIYERIFIFVCVAFHSSVQGSPLSTNEEHKRDGGSNENGVGRLGILVSPIMTWKMVREIVIHWSLSDLREGDQLVLYNGEPEVNGTEAIYTHEPSVTRGTRRTKVRAPFVPTAELTFEDRCLNYYLAWVRDGVIRKATCLATHPNWMTQRRATIGSMRLNQIFIPGTHDSGAYDKRENSKFESVVDKYTITQKCAQKSTSQGRKAGFYGQALGKISHLEWKTLGPFYPGISLWNTGPLYCLPDEDILSQLIYGVRYLDIRVGRYPGVGSLWWVNHGYFSIHPLSTIIEDVKIFLNNTQEIVIFDVQEFPVGFERDSFAKHDELVAYLEDQFADYYLPKTGRGWGLSLDEIWASGKKLIIGYDNNRVYPRHDSMWPPVTHRWPNVKQTSALYRKIASFENGSDPVENVSDPNRPPSSVMAQLTPETLDALLDLLGGLRSMAELVNANVTDSYNDAWRCTANIVSMDYIRSSGIIEAALEWNDRRASVC